MIGVMANAMVKANIHGLMVEFIKENGKKISSMGEEYTVGLTEENMTVNMKMTRNTDLVRIIGQTESPTKDNG